MSKKKSNSRELRRLAELILQKIAEDEAIPEADHHDLATSLVRQWITYDGNATLFVGERQIYLVLARTATGQFGIVSEQSLPGWMKCLAQDWKINPDEFPSILGQLNLGQSIEVINSEGVPLRLWVNPQERTKGVEPLVKEPVPPGWKRDHRKIAGDLLEQSFGSELEPDAMDELVCSVVKQWEKHDGHACLFYGQNQQVAFTLTEKGDGNCHVAASQGTLNLESLLSSLSVPPEIIPDVIARINLGLEVEFQDAKGIPSVVWHDPKAKRLAVRVVTPRPPAQPSGTRPIFCPKCNAVLRPDLENEPYQTCPMCGHLVSLG